MDRIGMAVRLAQGMLHRQARQSATEREAQRSVK